MELVLHVSIILIVQQLMVLQRQPGLTLFVDRMEFVLILSLVVLILGHPLITLAVNKPSLQVPTTTVTVMVLA